MEEQLRKSVSENPVLVEHSTASQSLASVDKSVFDLLSEICCLVSSVYFVLIFSSCEIML